MNIKPISLKEEHDKVSRFGKELETPYLVLDLGKIRDSFNNIKENMPTADVYYAVKANPEDRVITLFNQLGSNFDIASIYELNKLLSLNINPNNISYGNVIKKAKDVKFAYEKGVRLYATDSEHDIKNLVKHAPNSKVFIRILVEGSKTSDWPLARKFGCTIDEAKRLIHTYCNENINIEGVSFHVGSQQNDIKAWHEALKKVKEVFDWAKKEHSLAMNIVNIGGGIPVNYELSDKYLDRQKLFFHEIDAYIKQIFAEQNLKVIIEPGRSLLADSGVLVTSVVLVSKKDINERCRWVYLDVGKFGGMIETLDEMIKYPIYCEQEGEASEVIIAGPTCDSVDILYEQYKYHLPNNLTEGDKIYFFKTGAYTSSYSSIEFNGIPPLKVHTMD